MQQKQHLDRRLLMNSEKQQGMKKKIQRKAAGVENTEKNQMLRKIQNKKHNVTSNVTVKHFQI